MDHTTITILAQIYNTLRGVLVRGEDAGDMNLCIRGLANVIARAEQEYGQQVKEGGEAVDGD